MHLTPLHILVVSIAGRINREQSTLIEYLQEEMGRVRAGPERWIALVRIIGKIVN